MRVERCCYCNTELRIPDCAFAKCARCRKVFAVRASGLARFPVYLQNDGPAFLLGLLFMLGGWIPVASASPGPFIAVGLWIVGAVLSVNACLLRIAQLIAVATACGADYPPAETAVEKKRKGV